MTYSTSPVTLLLFAIPVVALVIWRNLRPRPLRAELLWVRPAMLVLIGALVLYARPPHGAVMIAVCAAALAVGVALGWMRGRMMRITVDPQTHLTTVQGSVVAVAFILAIVFGKVALQMLYPTAGASSGAGQIGDVLLLLGIGLVGAQGVEMWLRAKKLIAQSRAAAAA